MENSTLADRLEEIADLLDLQKKDGFRIRAYRSAGRAVRALGVRVADLVERGVDLTELPAIGTSIAGELRELVETGTCERLEKLRSGVPSGLLEVLRVPGIGPRKAWDLWQTLGVTSLADLARAIEKHTVRDVPGMGEKTEEKLRQSLATAKEASARLLLHQARAHLDTLGRALDRVESIERWEAAGSWRRRRETVGDLDLVIEASDRDAAAEAIVDFPGIREVIGQGEEKVSVRLDDGFQVDFRFVEPAAWGAAELYFTGSKAHNIELRQRALRHRFKLNEYGLWSGERRIAGRTEQAVYRKLGLAWIPPELRELEGEIAAAEAGELPHLIELGDLRGDLHCHTTASDGRESIEEMARAARERGYSYLAITDHSKALPITHGLDEARLRRHARRIRELDRTLDRFWLLAGIEVDILADGRLDLETDALAELDWVVASLHSGLDHDQRRNTARVMAAIESGVVDCIGHPFARRLDRRGPVKLDFEQVVAACVEHGVALEINGQPHRLDLPWMFARQARDAGVKLVLSTDAHRASELDYMEYAVGEARRGWIEKGDVVNTASLTELRRLLGRRRRERR